MTTLKGSIWRNKVVAGSGSVQALKIESSGGSETATVLPNCIIGGANNAVAGVPIENTQPVMAYSKSVSLFGSLTSASAAGVSYVYIGTPGETAEQTVHRVNSLKNMAATDSTSTDSDTSDSKTSLKRSSSVQVKAPAAAQTITATVASVHDGDGTLKCVCADGITRTVRMYGIDAPELKQAHGPESRAALAAMALNKTVALTIPAGTHDAHGRTVAKLTVDGIDVNLTMVKTGNAWAYSEYLSAADKPVYLAAQKAAQEAKLGLWAQLNPQAPWLWRKAN